MPCYGLRALLVGNTSRIDVLVEAAVQVAWKGRALLLSASSQARNTTNICGEADESGATVSRLSAKAISQLRSCRHLRRRLRFALTRSPADLASLLVSIHTWRRQVPHALLLDGLDELVPADDAGAKAMLICASLLEAANTCARITNVPCQLHVSIDTDYYLKHKAVVTTLADNFFDGNLVHL
ncbi:uncharacterized protein LOC143912118 [Arctopsyche grandis]|uniref:uncharacterized protein LOC143912118 n=1 Tax=Arctopsyche grandis TaxID=121162 RepID=UPI00406D84D2